MGRRRPLAAVVLSAAAAAAAALPSAAAADFAPVTAADGPNANVLSLGGIDLARGDATGALAYLKRDLGQPHVFSAPLLRGDPRTPARVDTGQLQASSDVHMASGNLGRTVVVWINNGLLYGAVKPAFGNSFEAPKQICSACGPASEPSVDMSIFGTAYVTFTTAGGGGHDVRAAVLSGGNWTPLSAPLDIDPARDAQGAKVSVSADGTAMAAWTETGPGPTTHVYERRLLHTRPSSVPQEAGVGSLDGRAGGSADSPAVEVQDDSTFAWVAFRQDFNDGGASRSRVIARRLVGSKFDTTVRVDGLVFGSGQSAERPVLDITSRGYGMALANLQGSNAINGAVLSRRRDPNQPTFEPPVQLDTANGGAPHTTATSSEDAKGIAAWQRTAGSSTTILARFYDGTQFLFPHTLSPPAYGNSAAELGLDSSSDGAGDSVVAFVQGGPTARRIQVVAYAGKLAVSRVAGTRRWKRQRRPQLKWGKTQTVPWGPVHYRLEIDGLPVATTDKTSFKPVQPLSDGVHAVRLVAIDGRGSETAGRDVGLRIDTTKPHGRIKRLGKGLFSVSASDGPAILGSGISKARLVFGKRSVILPVPSIALIENAHIRHRGGGRPRLVLIDKAGNKKVVK